MAVLLIFGCGILSCYAAILGRYGFNKESKGADVLG
jgi:hypothetical protein